MLDGLKSIVNGFANAQDKSRAFTFIEFIKISGYNNDSNTFASLYKEYLTAWADKNTLNINAERDEYVRTQMINILRTITLTYSSYEEQDFIAHIDWSDKKQIKSLVPF